MAEIKANEISEKNLLNGFIKDVKKGEDAIDDFNKSLKETLKIQDKIQKQAKKDTTSKGLKEQSKNLKKVDSTIKMLSDTQKVSLQLAKDREKAELKLKKLNSDKIQSTVQLNRLSKEQNTINKETEILNNKQAGTLEKLAVVNTKLRRERGKLNLETLKGQKRLREINKELDKNNKFIEKNSDKLKKQKINVGNYTNSIKDAAAASGLFGGVLGKLNAIQATLAALTRKNVVAGEADAAVKEQQAVATAQLSLAQRGLNRAQAGGVKALKALKVALIGSGIGVILVALGSFVAFLTRIQGGIDAVDQGTAGLTATFDVLIDRFSSAASGFVKVFKGLFTFLTATVQAIRIVGKALRFEFKEAGDAATELFNDLKDAPSQIIGGINDIAEAFKGITLELEKETKLAIELRKLTQILTREQKLFEAEQAASLTTVKELNLISRDKLETDLKRVQALKDANKIEVEVAKRQLILQEQALAGALDSISADRKRLELLPEQLKFIEKIKDGTISTAEAVEQAAAFTLSSAAGEQALFEIVDKIVAQEQAKQSLLDKQATTIKKLSALQVQIATKNATARQQEAAFQRELFKDEDLQLEKRIAAIELARDLDIEGNKFRLDANIINEAEFQARKLILAKKTEEEIQRLLAKTAGIDTDFEAIARKQVKIVNDIEQEILQNDLDRLQRRLDTEELTAKERERILDEIFETRKTKAKAQAEFLLSNEELTAEERELINIKLAKSLEDIENDRVDAVVNANNKILESDKELQAQREALADARINTAKNVADILSTLAGDDEARQKQIQDLQKALAVSEILINLRREVSGIREGNAGKDNAIVLNRAQTLQARTAALAGVAQVLSAYDGVDDTGGRGDVDSKGGKLWTLHPNEQVTSLKDRQAMADPITGKLRTRAEIKERVNFADNLMMSPHAFKQMEVGQIVQPKSVDLSRVVQGLSNQTKELKEAFKDGQVTYDVHWNSHGEAVEREKRKGLITRRTHKRSRL